jgi:hypothetical protein
MNERVRHILAVVKTDFLLRFRRPSTAVIFLILCAAAYLWIPAPSTGKALIQVEERRALYNSIALAIGTSTIFTLLMGLFGYYLVSNSIKRDIQTRTGFILASTTLRNGEYLAGKFIGNIVFLSSISIGFLISSMIMQLIRGEAPLEPLTFIGIYLLMVPPLLVFISTIAIIFESTKFLSGKFGDVLYFMVWIGFIAFTAVGSEHKHYPHFTSYVDSMGMGYLFGQMKTILGSDSLAIGSSHFDMTKAPFVISTFPFHAEWILPRLISLVWTIPLLLIPLVRFHRFNPDRIKTTSKRIRHGFIEKINSLVKPVSKLVTAPFSRILNSGSKPSFFRSIAAEILLTLQIYPAATVLIVFFTIFFALLSPSAIQNKLPLAFAAMVVVLADMATREKTIGTMPVIFAAPKLRNNFVFWKLITAMILAIAFVWIAVLKLLFVQPFGALALIGGAIFAAACATALGILTSNPKTFIVLFLFFLYLVMNDGGQNPFFDFAGWFKQATFSVVAIYAAISVAFITLAESFHRIQLKRNY